MEGIEPTGNSLGLKQQRVRVGKSVTAWVNFMNMNLLILQGLVFLPPSLLSLHPSSSFL